MTSTANEKLILAGFVGPHPDKRERVSRVAVSKGRCLVRRVSRWPFVASTAQYSQWPCIVLTNIQAVELWGAIADDARATQDGKVSIELYEEQGKGDDRVFLVLDQYILPFPL